MAVFWPLSTEVSCPAEEDRFSNLPDEMLYNNYIKTYHICLIQNAVCLLEVPGSFTIALPCNGEPGRAAQILLLMNSTCVNINPGDVIYKIIYNMLSNMPVTSGAIGPEEEREVSISSQKLSRALVDVHVVKASGILFSNLYH